MIRSPDLGDMRNFRDLSINKLETKRNAELTFWRENLCSKGGIDYWRRLYFELYCHYLGVHQHSFAGKILMDIGCGPHGAISLFEAKSKIGVDPLAKDYHRLFDLSGQDVVYLHCGAENIPLVNEMIDVVISRNAIDHVDDLTSTFCEIHRVLRNGGEIILSVNYQEKPTTCEPHVLNDGALGAMLQGRFAYEIVKRFPVNYDSGIGGFGQFRYPHEIALIRGTKL